MKSTRVKNKAKRASVARTYNYGSKYHDIRYRDQDATIDENIIEKNLEDSVK